MDKHLKELGELLNKFGTKYYKAIPSFYYCLKLTESEEGRKMLIENGNHRKAFSWILDDILKIDEFPDTLHEETKTKYLELITYWRKNSDSYIFGADELY